MGNENYTGAVMAMGLYAGLMQDIVRAYGWDRAAEMHAGQGWSMGVSTGEEIKKAAGGGKPDLARVVAANTSVMTGLGCAFTTPRQQGPVATWDISRCPIYDGLKAGGFSHEQIKLLCEAFDGKFYPGVSSVVPPAVGSVQFRKTPEDSCKERWEVR